MSYDHKIDHDNCCCSCRLFETVSLNCGHQRAYCTSRQQYMSMERHGGMKLTGQNRITQRKCCATSYTVSYLGGSGFKSGQKSATLTESCGDLIQSLQVNDWLDFIKSAIFTCFHKFNKLFTNVLPSTLYNLHSCKMSFNIPRRSQTTI
jgi:hypothetical protein